MKIRLNADEAWPSLYETNDEVGGFVEEIDVPDELVLAWREARAKFYELDLQMVDAWSKASRARRYGR